MKKGAPGKAANTDPKVTLMRRAKTAATTKHTISGRPRTKGLRPITLPTQPILPLRRTEP